jgi:phosphosulfolactate synthase
MNQTTLHLPRRTEKPREVGLTMVIDGGIPLWYFTDLMSSSAEYIDFVKFGWGTAVVSSDLHAKIRVLSTKDIGFYFGGTLFEKYVLQGRFDDFRRFCQLHSCRHVEVSNGTISMSNSEKASYIRKLADDFTVVSEVGFKDPVRSEQLPPEMWVEYISEDLEAGASLVTLEARESGKSGICRPDGTLRSELIEDVAPNTKPPSLYPRHFGVTFREAADFEALHKCAVIRKIPFFYDVSTRFEGLAEEHRTFVLLDPSGNLLEFKHYRDPRMMY